MGSPTPEDPYASRSTSGGPYGSSEPYGVPQPRSSEPPVYRPGVSEPAAHRAPEPTAAMPRVFGAPEPLSAPTTAIPVTHLPTTQMPIAQVPPSEPPTSVYRGKSSTNRRRILLGLGGVALLLIGYGIGRWQDTPSDPVTTLPGVIGSGTPSAPAGTTGAADPATTAPTTAPPSPTVYQTMQAEAANALNGIQSQDTEDEGGGKNVGWIANGDSMRFDGVDFGPVAATKLEVRVASDGNEGGRMEVHIDSPEKAAVGVLNVTKTGGWQNWRTDLVPLSTPVTGTHTVFFVFAKDGDDEFVNVNWLLFEH